MSLDREVTDLLKALETYVASTKRCAIHAGRVVALGQRVQVLMDLHHEMHANLLVEHEATKEIMEATGNPTPPALTQFLAHYEEFKVVHKLLQEAVKAVGQEKDFLDWQLNTTLPAEYAATQKPLSGG